MRCHLLLLPVFALLTVACSDSASRSSGTFDERGQPPVSNPGGTTTPAANEIAATPPSTTTGTSTGNGQGGPGGGGNPVPEPGTLLLLGTGLAGASLLRRKKRETA